MVTASHNPPDYNGMKFVRQEARPISADTGLQDMRRLIETGDLPPKAARPGTERPLDIRGKYLEHLLSYVKRPQLRKLKVVVNPGNGGAGLIIDALEPHLPFEFTKVNHEPDGTFPNGVPNPMLEENRAATADVVRRAWGVAFAARGRAHAGLRREPRGERPPCTGGGLDPPAGALALRVGGPGDRSDRRPVDGGWRLALQPARLEHRAAGAPERRG